MVAAAAVSEEVRLGLSSAAQAGEVGAAHLRAARAVPKCVYLLQTRSQRVLKRMAAECAGMTEATAAAVESVGLVLQLTT